ncbi:hypothetical protein [Clostridium oryzae]|uniref:DUF4129 domain-containing protein n=1 Tax=Clostridium oryzae TaxID=1450648 RepID=A0A1V4IQP2_9CLOT|nr:hypothetical protein [Clostridium oryzae]OPJ62130.1 hypothetical protein CLORY_19530 [Clostridium oryzae]
MVIYKSLNPSSRQFEDTINSIINRVDYVNLRNGIADFIDNVKQAIIKFLIKIIKGVIKGAVNAPKIADNLSTIFIIIAIVTIAAVLIVIVVKISKTFERKGRITEILGEKIDERTTPVTLRKKAEEFLKAKDYRSAVRFEFIALLLLMHERNVVYLDETNTNEEIYEYLKTTGFNGLDSFKKLINIFNNCWYGHRNSSEQMYNKWIKELTLVWNGVVHSESKKK